MSAAANLDDIIGLSYRNNRVHFRVRWIGKPGTPKAGHVGLLNLPGKTPLGFFLTFSRARQSPVSIR